ncbi:Deleted in malignant brain tumors 1 protein [Trichoplax sp. H2]|nr:Deleted in malignant brain tumors 1 protein [Trichoplax sp. H2]|eukprot:RDD42227.1 Deleted in malignant brain tumors 1 protein [Trichoplax sp. H2]
MKCSWALNEQFKNGDLKVCQRNRCDAGLCYLKGRTEICVCYNGYFGDRCQHAVPYPLNPCHSNPCHYGKCISYRFRDTLLNKLVSSYLCQCNETTINSECHNVSRCFQPCASNPCVNGICTVSNNKNGFNCLCKSRWTGKACEIEVKNPCASNPCLYNGICSVRNESTDYVCSCRNSYTGRNCDTGEVTWAGCLSNPCPNNATCVLSNYAYSCICPPLYYGNNCQHGPVKTGEIQLSGIYHGIPLVYFNNTWGSICLETKFHLDKFFISNVICMQLGYRGAITSFHSSPNFDISPILLVYRCFQKSMSIGQWDINCKESDQRICSLTNRKCRKDVRGVTCVCAQDYTGKLCEVKIVEPAEGAIRLKDENAGSNFKTVEIYHHGFWGGIYANTTNLPEATVICRQLGYKFVTWYSCCPTNCNMKIWVNGLHCLGNESKLADCQVKYGASKSVDSRFLLKINCQDNICHKACANGTCIKSSIKIGNINFQKPECQCFPGYFGNRCQFFNHCQNLPCLNNGTCEVVGFEYRCHCRPEYYGKNCEHGNFNTIANKKELNFGICKILIQFNKFYDVDPSSFGNVILSSSISNATAKGYVKFFTGGQWRYYCPLVSLSVIKSARVVCQQLGFAGYVRFSWHRITKINIQLSPITHLSCSGFETSILQCNSTRADISNSTNGRKCLFITCLERNECASNPCSNGATCANMFYGYKCLCPPNYTGTLCQDYYELTNGTVWLFHGRNHAEGFAQIYLNNQWNSICSTYSSTSVANIICKTMHLGFKKQYANNYFGIGATIANVTAYLIHCRGPETNISECMISKLNSTQDCTSLSQSTLDVSVTCSDSTRSSYIFVAFLVDTCSSNPCQNGATCLKKKQGYECICGELETGRHCETSVGKRIRLTHGGSNYGRVEIYYNAKWGAICDTLFGKVEADVACLQLGFQRSVNLSCCSYYGRSYIGAYYLKDLYCRGYEKSLMICGWGSMINFKCARNKAVGIFCTDNPCQPGLCRNGNCIPSNNASKKYYCRCHDGFRGPVCDQIDYCFNSRCISNATCVNDFSSYACLCPSGYYGAKCDQGGKSSQGLESDIFLICDLKKLVFIVIVSCTGNLKNGDLRIIDMKNNTRISSGILQIYNNGTWAAILKSRSEKSFTLLSGLVACRRLGFRTIGCVNCMRNITIYRGSRILYLSFNCSGGETSLLDCPNAKILWNVYSHRYSVVTLNCSDSPCQLNKMQCLHGGQCIPDDSDIIGFRCKCPHQFSGQFCEFGMESSLRLQDGISPYDGRLEIFHNRQWGGVCDDNFSMVEANVACNQLGYGKALSYFCCSNVITKSQRRYRQINFYGVYWLDNVKCSSKVKKLSDCHHAGWGMNNCGVTEAVSIQCEDASEGEIKLINTISNASMEGIVQIFHKGEWMTICDDFAFNVATARVICRQLGFVSVNLTQCCSRYGHVTSTKWLRDLNCSTNETTIHKCLQKSTVTNSCTSIDNIGIRCSENPCSPSSCLNSGICMPDSNEIRGYRCECKPPYSGIRCEIEFENSLRLVSGPDKYSGRLQIYHKKVWGAICDDKFSLIAASVACRQLGYDGASSFKCCSYMYGADGWHLNNFGFYWLDDLDCIGNETELASCNHASWGQTNCRYNEAVSIKCYELDKCSSNPCINGRCIKTHTIPKYKCICSSGFTGYHCDTGISCLSHPCNASFKSCEDTHYGHVCICRDGYYGENCEKHAVNGALRLINDNSTQTTSGIVQIYQNGTWGTVCSRYSFSRSAANILCKQLGYKTAFSYDCCSKYAHITGKIWIGEINCYGNETSINDCPQLSFNSKSCMHQSDVGLHCSEREGEVRLIYQRENRTGQLEIFHKSSWHTVCGYRFNMNAANVACRQLGFLKAEKINCCSRDTEHKEVFLNEFVCLGDEKSLLDCKQRYQRMCTYRGDIIMSLTCSNGQCRDGTLRCSSNASCVDSIATSYCTCPNGYYGRYCDHRAYYGDIRLTYSTFGRVEIYSGGSWNSICIQGFSSGSALVICRQLGFKSYKSYHVSYKSYADATGGILMDSLNCTGHEQTILKCPYNIYTKCNHNQDVAVECTDVPCESSPCLNGGVCISGKDNFHINCNCPQWFTGRFCETALENALRLVRGSNNRTGRLEIFHNKRWGAICDDGFNDINAHVACKQLGFVSFEWYHCCSVYGIDEFLWMENITCYGNESMLANCSHSPWGSHDCSGYETMSLKCRLNSCITGNLRCSSNATCYPHDLFQDAYCRCPDGSYGRQCEYHGVNKGDLRLVPNVFYPGMKSMSGRIEVYANGTWNTICGKGFTKTSAELICHRLGYNGVKSYYKKTNTDGSFGKGYGRIIMSHLQCLGNETSILDCPYHANVNCDHLHDVSIICSDEICRKQVTPCMYGRCIQGKNAAEYECACQRGYTGQNCSIEINECASNPCGPSINNQSICVAGVDNFFCQCAEDDDKIKIRLFGGSHYGEGYVKIFQRGRWEIVCNDGWKFAHANVACRQLGFKAARMSYVRGNRNKQLTFIKSYGKEIGYLKARSCSGNQVSLNQCLFSILNSSQECFTGEVAGITCIDKSLDPSVEGLASVHSAASADSLMCPNDQIGRSCSSSPCIRSNGSCIDIITPFQGYICTCSSGFWDESQCQSETFMSEVYLEPNATRFYLSESISIKCSIVGKPKPDIAWLKDNVAIHLNDHTKRFHIVRMYQESNKILISWLTISELRSTDAGNYTCIASFRHNKTTKLKQGSTYLHYEDIMDDEKDCFRYSVCDRNAICRRIDSKFLCQCNEGYTGNGHVCQDIDECQSVITPCGNLSTCINVQGSYRCKCKILVNISSTILDGTEMKSDQDCSVKLYTATVILSGSFNNELYNKTSTEFKSLAALIRTQILKIYRDTVFNGTILDILINRIRPGSIKVELTIVTRSNASISVTKLLNTLRKLPNLGSYAVIGVITPGDDTTILGWIVGPIVLFCVTFLGIYLYKKKGRSLRHAVNENDKMQILNDENNDTLIMQEFGHSG